MLVSKEDGSTHFCVDRKLNNMTKPDVFPLPRIDDCLQELSVSPLSICVQQVQMEPSSIEKTAFVTHAGSFDPCRIF